MLRLNSSQSIEAVLAGAVATTEPAFSVSYSDKTATTYGGASLHGDLTGASAVEICPAPATDTQRDVDYASIKNNDTAQITLTVRCNDDGTPHEIVTFQLEAGAMAIFVHGAGWTIMGLDGARKTTAGQGGAWGGITGTLSDQEDLQAALDALQRADSFADAEIPAGSIDGVNAAFALANAPSPAASLQLFRNGVLQRAGGVDYTLAGSTVTYSPAPSSGDTHVCSYRH